MADFERKRLEGNYEEDNLVFPSGSSLTIRDLLYFRTGQEGPGTDFDLRLAPFAIQIAQLKP